jgi:glycerol-3-phosphate dehydrogenase
MLNRYGRLVRPLNFLLAIPEGTQRSALQVRFGLWLYRRFAGRDPIHDVKKDRYRLEQLLDKGQRWSVFAYEDAQCEYPERIVIAWLLEAAADGAVPRNYTEALEVLQRDEQVIGVRLRDRLSQHEYFVSATWVINATGPWVDAICRRSNVQTDEPLVGGVRGSHILLPTFNGAPNAAIYAEAVDGRPIFIIPWAGQLLVGTTEVKDQGDPTHVTATPDEISYLLSSFQRLFPSIGYQMRDIRAAFAGIRPLPYISEQSPNSITRKHFLVDHKDDDLHGMISVVGGKLTTAASLAREVAKAVGIKVIQESAFAIAPLAPAPLSPMESWFGPAVGKIRKLCRRDSALAKPLGGIPDHTVAEAIHSVRNEYAVTLADILLRRVPVAFDPSWTQESVIDALIRVGNVVGWNDPAQTRYQLENFQAEYRQFLARPEHRESQAATTNLSR